MGNIYCIRSLDTISFLLKVASAVEINAILKTFCIKKLSQQLKNLSIKGNQSRHYPNDLRTFILKGN